MEFSRPNTKEEMYRILKDIFFYYRIRRDGYTGTTTEEIHLARLNFTELSEAELYQEATQYNAAAQYEFKTKYVEDINKELYGVSAKLQNLPSSKQARENKVIEDFNGSVEKLNLALAQNGLIGSSIAIDKLAELEIEKNKLLAQIEAEYQLQQATLIAEQQRLNERLNNADSYCQSKSELENQAKKKELLLEQQKLGREVFKYNNGLDEKEQRQANTVKEVNASLELKFLEIQSGEYTKDQLVEMGYYEDVINCVCDYYDTLEALDAAQQITSDRKIVEYLDDYYQNVVYMYQQRVML